MQNIRWCVTALAALAALAVKGAPDMPMLNWMGREKAAKVTKDVVMKILREEKLLGYGNAAKDNILVHDCFTLALHKVFCHFKINGNGYFLRTARAIGGYLTCHSCVKP